MHYIISIIQKVTYRRIHAQIKEEIPIIYIPHLHKGRGIEIMLYANTGYNTAELHIIPFFYSYIRNQTVVHTATPADDTWFLLFAFTTTCGRITAVCA